MISPAEPGTAVVTGAGSGIGRCVTDLLAASGYRVVAVDLSLESASSASITRVEVDLSSPASLEPIVTAAGEAVAVLVNAAAIRPTGPFEQWEESTWRQAIDVNLIGAARLTAALSSRFVDGQTAILNVASGAAFGKRNLSVYAASKAALMSFTRTLALELAARQIRANIIVPGTTDTQMLASARATSTGTTSTSAPRNYGGAVLTAEVVAADIVATLNLTAVTGAVIPIGVLPWDW